MKKTKEQLDKTYDIIEKVSTQIAVKGKNKSKALLEEAENAYSAWLKLNNGALDISIINIIVNKLKQSRTALLKEVNDIVDECVDCDNCESGACGCEAFRIKPKLKKLEVKEKL